MGATAAVAVAGMIAQLLQLPIEQADEPSAHDLILRDGDRARAFGAGVSSACHADNKAQRRAWRKYGTC